MATKNMNIRYQATIAIEFDGNLLSPKGATVEKMKQEDLEQYVKDTVRKNIEAELGHTLANWVTVNVTLVKLQIDAHGSLLSYKGYASQHISGNR